MRESFWLELLFFIFFCRLFLRLSVSLCRLYQFATFQHTLVVLNLCTLGCMREKNEHSLDTVIDRDKQRKKERCAHLCIPNTTAPTDTHSYTLWFLLKTLMLMLMLLLELLVLMLPPPPSPLLPLLLPYLVHTQCAALSFNRNILRSFGAAVIIRLLWYSVMVLLLPFAHCCLYEFLSCAVALLVSFCCFCFILSIRYIGAVIFSCVCAVLCCFFRLLMPLLLLVEVVVRYIVYFEGPKTSFLWLFFEYKTPSFHIETHCLSHYHIL